MHARLMQNAELKEERDQLKLKIAAMKTELVATRETTWKKKQFEDMQSKVLKYEALFDSQQKLSQS
jgi:hypothetical protein